MDAYRCHEYKESEHSMDESRAEEALLNTHGVDARGLLRVMIMHEIIYEKLDNNSWHPAFRDTDQPD